MRQMCGRLVVSWGGAKRPVTVHSGATQLPSEQVLTTTINSVRRIKQGRIVPEGEQRALRLLLRAKSAQAFALFGLCAEFRGIPALSHGDVAESEQIGADGLPLGNGRKLALLGLPAQGVGI